MDNAKAFSLTGDIVTKLLALNDERIKAWSAALHCKMILLQDPGPFTLQSETKLLRAALDRIADLHSEADELLDRFECEVELIDQNGQRIDEPTPARLQSVETARVCLACQQSSTGRCSTHSRD